MTANGSGGNYYRPQPVDFILLEAIPEKGMIGGIHWKGKRAKDLRADVIEATGADPSELPTTFIAARLRSMNVAGLLENFPGHGSGTVQIWARTEKGTEQLAKRDEVLGEYTS